MIATDLRKNPFPSGYTYNPQMLGIYYLNIFHHSNMPIKPIQFMILPLLLQFFVPQHRVSLTYLKSSIYKIGKTE